MGVYDSTGNVTNSPGGRVPMAPPKKGSVKRKPAKKAMPPKKGTVKRKVASRGK